jgi:hypothetical protein
MRSFDDWFDELCNGNQIWAEQISMHHKPKTFEDCARKVYNQYLAGEVFPPMQSARIHVGNSLSKVQPDKTYSKDWVTKALQKHEEEKKHKPDHNCPHCKGSGGVQVGEGEYSECPCVKEWIPVTGEERQRRLAELRALIDSMPIINNFPRVTEVEKAGQVLPPKPEPYPITTPEEAYVRDRHFEWIKNNFEARTGQKLPSWICEEDWNVIYDDQHLNGKGL